MSNALATYEGDFHAWAELQAELLRAGRLQEADVENIAEEIASLGRSERRELTSRLAILLTHLLKWQHQPEFRGRSWQLTIVEQRRMLDRHLAENPSLAARLEQFVGDAYGDAVIAARRETGLGDGTFSPACPFATTQLLAPEFLPD